MQERSDNGSDGTRIDADNGILETVQRYQRSVLFSRNVKNELRLINTAYSRFFLKLFDINIFNIRRFYRTVNEMIHSDKTLCQPSNAFENMTILQYITSRKYFEEFNMDQLRYVYDNILIPILDSARTIVVNDVSSFGNNKRIQNDIVYELHVLYPSAGVYHLVSDAKTVSMVACSEETVKQKHNIEYSTCITEKILNVPVIIDKLGMVCDYESIITARLFSYVKTDLEGARNKNYYTNTVLENVLSVHRTNLPATEAECLHNAVAIGNIPALHEYKRILSSMHQLDGSFAYIIDYIQHNPKLCEIVKNVYVHCKSGCKFGCTKNYTNTVNISLDEDKYHMEMCILKFTGIECQNVAIHLIKCAEMANVISAICPNGYIALDSVLLNDVDVKNQMNNYTLPLDERVLMCLRIIEQKCDALKDMFAAIDETDTVLRTKFGENETDYTKSLMNTDVYRNLLLKWSEMTEDNGKKRINNDFSVCFARFMQEIYEKIGSNRLILNDAVSESFKRLMRAGKYKLACNLLENNAKSMNIFNKCVDEYVFMQSESICRTLLNGAILREIIDDSALWNIDM